MKKEELAWAAGFFDGEGTVLIYGPLGKPKRLRISVSQVNPTPINLFHQWFGGHISFQKSRKKIGMINGNGNKIVKARQSH